MVKQRADEAKREAQRRDEEEKRILELMDWCKTTVGKDYHEVVNRFGLPRQTMDLPNGNKLLIFEWGVSWFKPRFETDPSGIVIRWTPCPARRLGGRRVNVPQGGIVPRAGAWPLILTYSGRRSRGRTSPDANIVTLLCRWRVPCDSTLSETRFGYGV